MSNIKCAAACLLLLLLTVACAPQPVLPTLAVLPSLTPLPTLTLTPSATWTPDSAATAQAERKTTSAAIELTIAALETLSAPTPTPSLTITLTSTPDGVQSIPPVLLYVRAPANLRACASRDCDSITQVQAGVALMATGSTSTGERVNDSTLWYRVDYNGQPAFVFSELVTDSLPTAVVVVAPFDEAAYVRALTSGILGRDPVVSVRVADGRTAGGERGSIMTYISTAATTPEFLAEWFALFYATGEAIANYSLDLDAVTIIVGDSQGNAIGILVSTAADTVALYREQITTTAFFSRMQGETFGIGSVAPPVQPPSACTDLSATCSQLTCAQARACLSAGNQSLDADGDGVPCESICPGE